MKEELLSDKENNNSSLSVVLSSLRTTAELIRQGFVTNIKSSTTSPSWISALFPRKNESQEDASFIKTEKELNEKEWRKYYGRKGLQTSLRILVGLCANHFNTQSQIVENDKAEIVRRN